jgi:hypothetical protein
MTIIEHMEKYLGKIGTGWRDNNGSDMQIVSFNDTPYESICTFTSLGMSKNILEISETKTVRQELLFSVYSMNVSNMIVSFLLSVCEAILNRKKAVLRGEVIPLHNSLSKRFGFDAVYCTIPVLFDDQFCTYDASAPPTVIVWIFPIYQAEADYIERNGWESFEDLLEEKNPDLFSLKRGSLI